MMRRSRVCPRKARGMWIDPSAFRRTAGISRNDIFCGGSGGGSLLAALQSYSFSRRSFSSGMSQKELKQKIESTYWGHFESGQGRQIWSQECFEKKITLVSYDPTVVRTSSSLLTNNKSSSVGTNDDQSEGVVEENEEEDVRRSPLDRLDESIAVVIPIDLRGRLRESTFLKQAALSEGAPMPEVGGQKGNMESVEANGSSDRRQEMGIEGENWEVPVSYSAKGDGETESDTASYSSSDLVTVSSPAINHWRSSFHGLTELYQKYEENRENKRAEEIGGDHLHHHLSSFCSSFPKELKYRLRKNGDTWIKRYDRITSGEDMEGSVAAGATTAKPKTNPITAEEMGGEDNSKEVVPVESAGAMKVKASYIRNKLLKKNKSSLLQPEIKNGHYRYNLIHVADPNIDHRSFEEDEGGAELVSAFRNILYDFYEIGQCSTLRIPVLALDTTNAYLQARIAKLNQVSLIQGFHRCPQKVKDWFYFQDNFKVEFFVPAEEKEHYQATFAEEPWEPIGVYEHLIKGTLDYFPRMPMPETLLQSPDYVGKRQEILDAIKTDGDSLLTPLDEQGRVVEQKFIGHSIPNEFKKQAVLSHKELLKSGNLSSSVSSGSSGGGGSSGSSSERTTTTTMHWKSNEELSAMKNKGVQDAEILHEEIKE